jgi:hypothetical protein
MVYNGHSESAFSNNGTEEYAMQEIINFKYPIVKYANH